MTRGKPAEVLCVDCLHHTGDGTWYNHYCHHQSVEKVIDQDPVTGEWHEDEIYPNCRDINTGGECHLFENRKTWRGRL